MHSIFGWGRTHPDLPWCRYADDGLVHCRTEQGAQAFKADLQARLAACGLEMHPTKTKIVYCKDSNRKGTIRTSVLTSSDTAFGPGGSENARTKQVFCSFLPAISQSALKSMRATVRDLDIRRQTQVSMADIARQINPLLRGWISTTDGICPRHWDLSCNMSIRRCRLGLCGSSRA